LLLREIAAGKPKLSADKFQHVSIITALNSHHDKINELASIRFASDMNEALVTFYSIDKWKNSRR